MCLIHDIIGDESVLTRLYSTLLDSTRLDFHRLNQVLIMAAIFGSLGPYDTPTDWTWYEMSLKQFLTANSIAAPTETNPDRRKAILLSSIGIRSRGVVRSLCAQDDPDTKSFDQLFELIRMHYGKPPTNSIARQNLSEAKQAKSEFIDEFLVRLRDLSIDCQYDAAVLKERLRE